MTPCLNSTIIDVYAKTLLEMSNMSMRVDNTELSSLASLTLCCLSLVSLYRSEFYAGHVGTSR